MKRILSFCCAVGLTAGATAQNFPYLMQAFQEPYQSLESPIDLTNGELWDDPEWFVYPPFPIYFMGDTLNELMISAPGAQVSQNVNTEPNIDLVIPYMADLMNASPDAMVSPVEYEVVGAEPNRIFKVEWATAGFYDEFYTTGTFGNLISFQIWFYESTGSFRIHFGPNTIKSADAYQIFGKPTVFFSRNISLMSVDFANDGIWTLGGNPANPTVQTIPVFTGELGPDQMLTSDPVNGQVYYFYTQENVGVAESNKMEWSAYPNPTKESIFIKVANDDLVEVYNVNGQLCSTTQVRKGTQQLDLSELNPGLYVLKLKSNPLVSKRITRL
jgi:hypothetical protein